MMSLLSVSFTNPASFKAVVPFNFKIIIKNNVRSVLDAILFFFMHYFYFIFGFKINILEKSQKNFKKVVRHDDLDYYYYFKSGNSFNQL